MQWWPLRHALDGLQRDVACTALRHGTEDDDADTARVSAQILKEAGVPATEDES